MMQTAIKLAKGKNCPKEEQHDCSAKKSLYGSCLDNPVVHPQPLDSTRLKDEPGGTAHSVSEQKGAELGSINANVPTATTQPNSPNQTHSALLSHRKSSYSSVLRHGLPSSVIDVLKEVKIESHPSNSVETIQRAAEGWEEVRYKRPKKSITSSDSTLSLARRSSERSYGSGHWALPVARSNSVGKQWLPMCKQAVKKPPGTTRGTPALASRSSLQSVEDDSTSLDETIPEYLRGAKRDDFETWWQVLGFTNQRGPIKRDKFVKALLAVGFTPRNQDGAKAAYNPPADFKGTKTRALALHLPHKVNIEYTELKNKAKTIRKLYPTMVDAMRKLWAKKQSM